MDFDTQWYPRRTPDILFLGFNQDASCLTVGSVTGFSIYSIKPFKLMYKENLGAITLVEMLYSSSLVSLVGSIDGDIKSCKVLVVWNTMKRKILKELYFLSRIHAVKMNPKRIVVCLERELKIYDLKTYKHLHWIKYDYNFTITPYICCLSPATERGYLVMSVSSEIGTINIIDIYNFQNLGQIVAHENSIKLLSFNSSGTLLATASTKGTVIRIWSTPHFERLWTCRRSTISCALYHLAFSSCSEYLISSGSSGSVYVFKLDIPQRNKNSYQAFCSQEPRFIFDLAIGQSPEIKSPLGSDLENEGSWINNTEDSKIKNQETLLSANEAFQLQIKEKSLKNVSKLFKSALNSLCGYLPTAYIEAINAFRCLAWVNLGDPCNTMPSIAIMNPANSNDKAQIFVACYTGCAYLYEFPLLHGGEARLIDELFITRVSQGEIPEEIPN